MSNLFKILGLAKREMNISIHCFIRLLILGRDPAAEPEWPGLRERPRTSQQERIRKNVFLR